MLTNKMLFVIAKLIFTTLLIGIVIKQLDYQEALIKLKSNNLYLVFLAFLIQNLSLISSSLRSKTYLQAANISLPSLKNLSLYYVGTFYNNFLPGGVGGDGYKVYLLSKYYSTSKLTLLKIFFCERVNGVFALIYLAFCIAYFSDFHLVPYLNYLIIAAVILGLPAYLVFAKIVLKDPCAIKALPLSFLTQILQIIFIYTIIVSFNKGLTFKIIADYAVIFSIASVLSILPITAGGIGIREITFIWAAELLSVLDKELGILIASISFLISLISSLTGGLFIFHNHSRGLNSKKFAKWLPS
ncbi:MAG: flippase-like domain-containing protein [Candidatus Midichloria sp.]|nr:flippase-like domain-containing protein [Candidatus Midichloria sp.]